MTKELFLSRNKRTYKCAIESVENDCKNMLNNLSARTVQTNNTIVNKYKFIFNIIRRIDKRKNFLSCSTRSFVSFRFFFLSNVVSYVRAMIYVSFNFILIEGNCIIEIYKYNLSYTFRRIQQIIRLNHQRQTFVRIKIFFKCIDVLRHKIDNFNKLETKKILRNRRPVI